MSRSNFPPRPQGHLTMSQQNRDLQNKLTYQQLHNMNRDLKVQNQQLKMISNRLGEQLNSLHTQFDKKPRQQNSQLYQAIGNHPTLHNFQMTLTPLFQAYQEKIQNFQHNFQTIYEQFIALQKKFEQVTNQNKFLKEKLSDKIKQNIQLYSKGSSQKINSDFGQLITQQMIQKQKILINENADLQGKYQKNKAQSQKSKKQCIEAKANYDRCKSQLDQLNRKYKLQEGDLKESKRNSFEYQVRNNDLTSEKNKVEQALQRAQSQINQLTKERDFYLKKHDEHKKQLQERVNFNSFEQNQSKVIQDLKSKITFLEAEKTPNNDQYKKYTKLSKDYEGQQKQNFRLKQTIEANSMKISELNDQIKVQSEKISKLQTKINELEIIQSKGKSTIDQLNNRLKLDVQKIRKQMRNSWDTQQEDHARQIQRKNKQLQDLQEKFERLTLQKQKLQKQNVLINQKNIKTSQKPSKQTQRKVQKLSQQINFNKDIFQERQTVLKNENQHLKKQKDSYEKDLKIAKDQLQRTKQQLEVTRVSLNKITQQKAKLTENIRKVRDQYDGQLKEKEKLFHQRIQQIKKVVEQSDKKRKLQREKVQQISRKYQNAVQQLRRMYQQNPSFRDDRKQKQARIVY